jgi:hypothetical protein
MNALNRETTIANRFPDAPSDPSIAETFSSGGASILNFDFFHAIASLRGKPDLI